MRSLEYYFAETEVDPGWDYHIGEEGSPHALTIAIEDAEPTATESKS